MRLFRRASPDPVLEAARAGFAEVAARVDTAQRALLAAIPSPRDDGVPLAEALNAFKVALADVADPLERWSAPDQTLGIACRKALDEAATVAEALRMEPASLTFEQLNARVSDVLYPLEVFAEIERALRRGELRSGLPPSS